MVYNLTNFTSANNIVELGVASNTLVDGWLFIILSALIFVIVFTATKANNSGRESFAVACFISFLLNGMLWGAGLVSETVIVVWFVLLLISIASFLIE